MISLANCFFSALFLRGKKNVVGSGCFSVFLRLVVADLGEVELLARASQEDVEHVVASRLEVRGCVVGPRDEDLALASVVLWFVYVAHDHEPEEKAKSSTI